MKRGLAWRVSAALVVCLTAVGCHGSSSKDDGQPVVVRVQYAPHAPMFIEGAVTKLHLIDRNGSAKATKDAALTTVPVLLGSVEPGRYTLRAAVRPCDGNCGTLDPPAFRCRGKIEVPDFGDARVIVTLKAKGCEVDQQGLTSP